MKQTLLNNVVEIVISTLLLIQCTSVYCSSKCYHMVLPLPLNSISPVGTSKKHEHVIDDDRDPCGDCFCPKQTLSPDNKKSTSS